MVVYIPVEEELWHLQLVFNVYYLIHFSAQPGQLDWLVYFFAQYTLTHVLFNLWNVG